MITIQQCHRAARALTDQVLSPLLFIGGYTVAALGIAVAITSGVMIGFAVFCCGIGAVGIARIIELLQAIEADLTVIRARLDSGVSVCFACKHLCPGLSMPLAYRSFVVKHAASREDAAANRSEASSTLSRIQPH